MRGDSVRERATVLDDEGRYGAGGPPDEPIDDGLGGGGSDGGDGGTLKEVVITIAAALALAYVTQGFLVKPFRIPSGSMENTLRCADRVLVDRVSLRFGEPSRGDVVVFHPPAGIDERGRPDTSQVSTSGGSGEQLEAPSEPGGTPDEKASVNYIKRVVGLPGDTVEVRDHRVYVDGDRLDEPYLRPLPQEVDDTNLANADPRRIPEGTYLMLGDNRNNSRDGREFGVIPEKWMVGKAFMVYWPPRRLGGLPERDAGGPADVRPDPNCDDQAAIVGSTADRG